MGGPVAARACAGGTTHAVKIHGSELEYAIRGRPQLAALAVRVARRGERALRRLGPHCRSDRGAAREGPPRPDPHRPARGRHRRVPSGRRRPCRPDRHARQRRGGAVSGPPGRAGPRRRRRRPARRAGPLRPLLREAHAPEGRPSAARRVEPPGPRVPGCGPRGRRLRGCPRRARVDARRAGDLHGCDGPRAPPSAWCRSPTRWSCRRCSRRRSGWSRPRRRPAVSSRSWPTTRVWPRSPPAWARTASRSTAPPSDLEARLAGVLALPDARRREMGLAARAAVVERWSWDGIAKRLIDASLS